MARQKHVLIWPCSGGNKTVTVFGSPGFTFAGSYATIAANLSSVFADTPGLDGTAISRINKIDGIDGITDESTTKPDRGAAMVCSFLDENGQTHKYRFPQPTDADMSDDGRGNVVLNQGAGEILATHLSSLTGFTLTFVRGWLDRAYQQS